jgi:trk system potassium uptake protein TrkA
MQIIIVGGGKLGYYLAKTLAPQRHHLVLIEEDPDMCQKIAGELTDLEITLIHGDGTSVSDLREAEIEDADILIAVTGHDQNNLVACQLAKNYFNVPRTIARVNNPKNINVFRSLGVDSVVSSTAYIADIIEHEVDWEGINLMLSQKVGNLRIHEFQMSENSKAAGKLIMDLSLPAGVILVSLIRSKEASVPNGQTRILAGDTLIAMGNEESLGLLRGYISSTQVEA